MIQIVCLDYFENPESGAVRGRFFVERKRETSGGGISRKSIIKKANLWRKIDIIDIKEESCRSEWELMPWQLAVINRSF
jgi:hypothetical protein